MLPSAETFDPVAHIPTEKWWDYYQGARGFTPWLRQHRPDPKDLEKRQVSPHVWEYLDRHGRVVYRAWHRSPHVVVLLEGASGYREAGRATVNPTRRWKLVSRRLWDTLKDWPGAFGALAGFFIPPLLPWKWSIALTGAIGLGGYLAPQGSWFRRFAAGYGVGGTARYMLRAYQVWSSLPSISDVAKWLVSPSPLHYTATPWLQPGWTAPGQTLPWGGVSQMGQTVTFAVQP